MARHHRIDYIEFPVRDLAAAKRFYGTVFGWEFTDYGDSYAGIRGLRPDDPEIGGFVRVEEVKVGGPLIVLYSDDLEATLAAVRDGGVTVVRAPYDFPGGRRFEFEDPDGHMVAVWAPTETVPPPPL